MPSEPTTHRITVTISEAAQRAAILAGEPAARKQTYDVPAELLPRLMALPWTEVTDDGFAVCEVPATMSAALNVLSQPIGKFAKDFYDDWAGPSDLMAYSGVTETRPSDAAAALLEAERVLAGFQAHIDKKRRTYQENRKANEDAARRRCEAWAALPVAERVHAKAPFGDEAARYVPEAVAEVKAYREREQAEREAAQAAKEEAKRAHIATRLAEIDEMLFAQWQEGMLCRDEAVAAIAAHVLDPIGEEADTETCDDRSCACGWTQIECVPASVYPAVRAVRARLPKGGKIERFDRGRSHEDAEQDDRERELGEAPPTTRYTADIVVPDGPFMLRRTVYLR
jgi:hypothetical protein